MSCDRRPWYPWYPKDFGQDEKVRALSDDAELLYRRALDIMWQANAVHMLNNSLAIANQIARGWSAERFENAWNEIMRPGWEIFKTTEDGNFVYSERLRKEAQKIETISKIKSECGRKANGKHKPSKSSSKAKHKPSHPDPDPDIKNSPTPLSGPRQIPDPFPITDSMRTWFRLKGFKNIVIEAATEQFVNYWKSKAKKMIDWTATWRNGMIKAEQWAAEKAPRKESYAAHQDFTDMPNRYGDENHAR